MNRTHLFAISATLLFCTLLAHTALSQDIRLNVSRPDQYAFRKMVVIKKSGERITTFLKINSFDPATGIFVLEGVTGETANISASDIKSIEFQQTLQRHSPMAQDAHWEISLTEGPELKYKVAQNALMVQSGELVFPATSSSTAISGTDLPSGDPAPRQGGSISSAKMVEARTITVDPPTKSFLIEVQKVMYTKETWGSSGLSGARK
jgi:hypothetical protein